MFETCYSTRRISYLVIFATYQARVNLFATRNILFPPVSSVPAAQSADKKGLTRAAIEMHHFLFTENHFFKGRYLTQTTDFDRKKMTVPKPMTNPMAQAHGKKMYSKTITAFSYEGGKEPRPCDLEIHALANDFYPSCYGGIRQGGCRFSHKGVEARYDRGSTARREIRMIDEAP